MMYQGTGAPQIVGGPQRGPVSRVEMRVECHRLKNKDEFSKSDPCAVMYMKPRGGKNWTEMGRTENIVNCLDPKFAKSFTLDYYFEEVQRIKVEVYDIDNSTPDLSDDDFLGQIECNLGEIVSQSPFHTELKKRDGSKYGTSAITIRSEEVKVGGEIAYMHFSAKKLDNKDFLGKSDPYIEISKQSQDGAWLVVHRTEVIKNTLNPTWRPFNLPINAMCGGDKSKQIKFDVYDWDSDGSHDLIGIFTTTISEMEPATGGAKEVSFQCINPKKQGKKKYVNSGVVYLTDFKLYKQPSFLEYIYGGMQINFTVGIDFTGSNGDPKSPHSLHYINPYQPNEYMMAIRAVGNVCQDYDTDKLFPALGFGAQLPSTQQVSMEFPINFNPQNPYCAGIDGVLQAYQNCITQVKLYGPTNVAPIIHHVARFAEAAQKEEGAKGAGAYYVLLLLTDGVISDMGNTRDAIVYASGLPMSLIIVGVGGADFADMNFLDGDNGVLKGPSGRPAARDIVQFVPFRDFKTVSDTASGEELARHVLAEVPQQVVQYFEMRKINPSPRPS